MGYFCDVYDVVDLWGCWSCWRMQSVRVKGSCNEFGKGWIRVWYGLESNVGFGDEFCFFYILGFFVLRFFQYLYGILGFGSYGWYFVVVKILIDRLDGRWLC